MRISGLFVVTIFLLPAIHVLSFLLNKISKVGIFLTDSVSHTGFTNFLAQIHLLAHCRLSLQTSVAVTSVSFQDFRQGNAGKPYKIWTCHHATRAQTRCKKKQDDLSPQIKLSLSGRNIGKGYRHFNLPKSQSKDEDDSQPVGSADPHHDRGITFRSLSSN